MLLNNYFTEMLSASEAISFSRLIDVCVTQLKAHEPSRRPCIENNEEGRTRGEGASGGAHKHALGSKYLP